VDCDHATRTTRRRWPERSTTEGPCRNPARYRVTANHRHGETNKVSAAGEYPCGLHVRPYLMDNGDSVWAPWVVTPLAR
jgi:hypothetical protein